MPLFVTVLLYAPLLLVAQEANQTRVVEASSPDALAQTGETDLSTARRRSSRGRG